MSARTPTGNPPSLRTYVVGGTLESWFSIAGALQQAGVDLRPVSGDADLAELARRAQAESALLVLDLGSDPTQGLARVRALRAASPALALGVAAASPSLDLAQQLRAAGVSCMLVHPLDAKRAHAALLEMSRAVVERAAGGKKQVLVIDDDGDFRTVVSDLLVAQGLEVRSVASGKEGLRAAMTQRPDLIILDIMMENDWAGYEVNQTIKFQSGYESVRHTPILMVSSIPLAPDARFQGSQDAAGFSPDSYLSKPIDIPIFLETVRRLLGLAGEGKGSPEP